MLDLIVGIVTLIAVLFIPGYTLTLAFFPKQGEIDKVERTTLSFVFSIVLLPLLVFLENILLAVPINTLSVWGTALLITAAGIATYYSRIGKLPLPSVCATIFPAVDPSQAVPIIPKIAKK